MKPQDSFREVSVVSTEQSGRKESSLPDTGRSQTAQSSFAFGEERKSWEGRSTDLGYSKKDGVERC